MDYMQLAKEVAKQSRCGRRQIGCVIVKDDKVLVSASNGIVSGNSSCSDAGGCIRKRLNIESGKEISLCYAPCAETRCICEAARDGISIKGATVYCTHKPCIICTRNLAAAEVDKVYYEHDYPDEHSDTVAKLSGLKVVKI